MNATLRIAVLAAATAALAACGGQAVKPTPQAARNAESMRHTRGAASARPVTAIHSTTVGLPAAVE